MNPLFVNATFILKSRRMRLLQASPQANVAYVIDVEYEHAWPEKECWNDIKHCPPEEDRPGTAKVRRETGEMKARRDAAVQRIAPLLDAKEALFDPAERAALIEAQALACDRSERTLYRDIRRWWQRGQTPNALLPDYHRCGGARPIGGTCKRGRKPKADYSIYQMTENDFDCMDKAINKHYLADERLTKHKTYVRMLQTFYRYEDGNGDQFVKPAGQLPSERQFLYFLRNKYPREVAIRSRKGDKEFEKTHRPSLGDVISDCVGVNHRYDVDATIADVFVVSEASIKDIIGKPTVYFIVERVARLIVGVYIGLENPCWMAAVEAIVSIAENKAELCKRFGVAYDPDDWPADGLFPQEFIGDHAELFTRASDQISGQLRIKVGNPPALRADWKPNVECSFKLIHADIADGTPGYDPPANAQRRRGKKYEKDACLTLKQFGALILKAVIRYNRRPMDSYPRTPDQLTREVTASPISLWNDGISRSSGLPPRFDDETVRQALWPRAQATCTDQGIEYGGCVYYANHPTLRNWVVLAKNDGRSKVEIAFDRRLVDTIYVIPPGKEVEPILATLTSRSEMYRGYSFAEVKYWDVRRHALRLNENQERLQGEVDYASASDSIVSPAKARLRAAGRMSRDARRRSTKAAREIERRQERIEIAGSRREPSDERRPASGVPSPCNVIGMPLRDGSDNATEVPLTPAQKIRRSMI
jgi:putative transposase